MNGISKGWRRAAVAALTVALAGSVALVAPASASAATTSHTSTGTAKTVKVPTNHSQIWEW